MKQVSTTQLAKSQGMSAQSLFTELAKRGLIEKEGKSWALTTNGKQAGGEYKKTTQYGTYIVWPENMNLGTNQDTPPAAKATLTATAIGRKFELSANKINFILSEIGWLSKGLKGWVITKQGKKQGGSQAEDSRSGVPYVRWPESILSSKTLKESVGHVKGTSDMEEVEQQSQGVEPEAVGFREKFEAKHRSADGHFVRSKAEMLIDNWLYMAEIVHAYERKLPIEEDVYSDFYIPTGKVYIEYWGYENDKKYLARKKEKIDIYNKYGFKLIELQDKDVQNLDDILPRLLLKHGVQAY